MTGEQKKEMIEVTWWRWEEDLLGRSRLVRQFRQFNSVDEAIKYALDLRKSDSIDSFEIRFY